MSAEPPPEIDLDALSEELTDDQLKYLLNKRIHFIGDAVLIDMLIEMRTTIREGVEMFHRGEKLAKNRRLKPDELLKLKKAIDDISPELHAAAAAQDPTQAAVANMAGDKRLDLDALSRATADPPRV